MKETDEFLILKEFFKDLGNQYFDSSGLLIGPGDDAGMFSEKDQELIFSTDVSVSGVHFPKNLDSQAIAYRACAVAASDIAACGGSLKWISISLTLETNEKAWIKGFAQGVIDFVETYKVPVIGGDLAKGKECSVSVGVCGALDSQNFMKRSGAKDSDDVYVTGNLGEAYLGLNLLTDNKKNLSNIEKLWIDKYLKPKLRFEFAQELSNFANSCIDVSDGLIADLNHICEMSSLGASLDSDKIPFSGELEKALTWGDDYELCFTAAASKKEEIDRLTDLFGIKISKSGRIEKEKHVKVLKEGTPVTFEQTGYNHFNE
jgi:thiamine-monophosphate kinase